MRRSTTHLTILLLAAVRAGALHAQETPAPANPPPAESAGAPEPTGFRPLEGPVIINLPSVDVPREGSLTLLFTHRFDSRVQDSNIHNLFSFDSGARIGIGLGYAPVKNLDVSFYRSSELDVYELAAKYRVLSRGPFGFTLRAGADWRTETAPPIPRDRSSFFAQAVLAWTLGDRVRVSAVPTYLSRTSSSEIIYQFPPRNDSSCAPTTSGVFRCLGIYENIVNVPVALSVAVTRSITIHGEVTPRLGKTDSAGVGWVVSLEKSVLRHRFCFTAGNQRQTTADRYTAALIPSEVFFRSRNDIYLGFNLVRQWKLR